MTRDFTIKKYKELCESMINSGYEIFTVKSYLHRHPTSDFVILRHDVDSRPWMALKMAELESRLGINSTYYFRYTRKIFDPKIIKQIGNMGHEIGYHYEVLSKTGGNYEEAIDLFKFELSEFKKICDINTICMHGSVLSKYDNKKLWDIYSFSDFGIDGEAYLSTGADFSYFSDTGWEWNLKHKLRDLMPESAEEALIDSTDDLFGIIDNTLIKNIYLLVHPGNWTESSLDWYYILIKNKLFNGGKMLLRLANSYENRRSY
jgi:hypothetical protein